MKIKLLIGSVVALSGLAVVSLVQAASITITDSSCTSFSSSESGGDVTITCGAAAAPPAPAVNAVTCNPIIASATTIDEGGSATLTANCPDATSYSWSPGGSTAQSITVTPAPGITTNYVVTASNNLPSSAQANIDVTVNVAAAPPSCTLSAFPASITSGQSTQLNAGCTGATTYVWTSLPTSLIPGISNPTVSPTVDTTYTLVATNSAPGTGGGSVLVPVAPAPVLQTFDCKRSNVINVNVQRHYDNAGDAFNIGRMVPGDAYTMSFTTGLASDQIQIVDIVEWAGEIVRRDATISEASCNYTSSADVRRVGDRINIKFTVGNPVRIGFIASTTYPVLKPNTLYYVNFRNSDPLNNDAETCKVSCGFNFKFFGTGL